MVERNGRETQFKRPDQFPSFLDWGFVEHDREIQKLIEVSKSFKNPELINEYAETDPSKLIIKEIPEYAGMKTIVDPLVSNKIGLDKIRKSCPHFNRRIKWN